MKEIISEPNYSPAELACVQRPTLVMMGAEDTVNAPDEHAQSIARHIPDAELWIPENTSHSVHHERHEEWISRVLGFLKKHVQ
jgi:pimeloyl-ACP methyl ester carboxylesterase